MSKNKKLEQYIKGYYKNAKEYYGVDGGLIKIAQLDDTLKIIGCENEKETICAIAWPDDYTAEQLYNIWMETFIYAGI